MRTVFGRKSVESKVPQALSEHIHLLEEYFEIFQIESSDQNQNDDGKYGVMHILQFPIL